MIYTNTLRNFVRDHGFSFKKQGRRRDIYKRPGDPHRMMLPRTSSVDDDFARSLLRQAGIDDAQIEAFITQYGNNAPRRKRNGHG